MRVGRISKDGHEPDGLAAKMTAHLEVLEEARGERIGEADDPLLVWVRSGAKFSMPETMAKGLNVGLNDESVHGSAGTAGDDERFAYDSYRQPLQTFGGTDLDIEASAFHEVPDGQREPSHEW